MTKQEIIKLFWGASYGGDIDENGWKPLRNNFIPSTLSIDISECRKLYRPKLLRGIEDNNGWIKIEKSEDLPKENGEYWTLRKNGIMIKEHFYLSNPFNWTIFYNITHYKPIEKPKPPLY